MQTWDVPAALALSMPGNIFQRKPMQLSGY
jgi:hypothetical protein